MRRARLVKMETEVKPTDRPVSMVYFDLGNVLLKFDHEQSCRNLGKLFHVPAAEVRDVVFNSGLEDQYETGELSTAEFYQRLCDRWKQQPSLSSVCVAAADIFTLNYPTLSVLTQLKAAGYRTGILSNTCEAHWKFVTDGRFRFLTDLFEDLILSYEVKSMKPAPAIYQAAIAETGLEAESIFFMDDREENVDGALRMGLNAVHFTEGHQLARDMDARGIHINY